MRKRPILVLMEADDTAVSDADASLAVRT